MDDVPPCHIEGEYQHAGPLPSLERRYSCGYQVHVPIPEDMDYPGMALSYARDAARQKHSDYHTKWGVPKADRGRM